ncbi:adenylate kinase [bacterium]|nr:adenylate kinase [bacterium]
MLIVLLGPPGAGKGTYAKKLEEALGIPHISTGDLLRLEVASKTELGKKIEKTLTNGELVSDEIMADYIEKILKENPNGVILDGYPRNMKQAKKLDELSLKLKINLDYVINCDIDDEVIIERLKNRVVCPTCGRVYNLISSPPKRDKVCDNDGTPLVHREDDNEDVVRHRLEIYRKNYSEILNYYRNRPGFLTVNTDGEIDAVFKSILERINWSGTSQEEK